MPVKTTPEGESHKRAYTARRQSWGRVRKLKSGRYQASYVGPDGESYNGPTTFDGKSDAEAWLADVRVTIQRGKWKSPKAIKAETFGPYARAWISQRVNAKGDPLRDRTKAEYLRYLDSGLSEFESDGLDTISPARVRTWHANRMKAGKTTAAREARLLRAVLNTAIEDRIIESNPVSSNLAQSSAGRKYRPPTEDELAAILATFEGEAPRLRLAVILAAYGGLRISEWRALRRQDVTLDSDRYAVNVTRQAQRARRLDRSIPHAAKGKGAWDIGPPKSAEGVRIVTLPGWATTDITLHLKTHVGKFADSLLFPPSGSAKFLDDNRFYEPWDIARDELGIKGTVREHDLRAFAGTYYARAGATMRETMALLGHSTTRAAMTYQHAVGDRAGELADLMPAPAKTVKKPAFLDAKRKQKAIRESSR